MSIEELDEARSTAESAHAAEYARCKEAAEALDKARRAHEEAELAYLRARYPTLKTDKCTTCGAVRHYWTSAVNEEENP